MYVFTNSEKKTEKTRRIKPYLEVSAHSVFPNGFTDADSNSTSSILFSVLFFCTFLAPGVHPHKCSAWPTAWAFSARWALGQLLDPCIPVLTSPRPMEQHLPWHRVRHRTTSSGVRGVIPVLVWNTNSKGRSVAWRMDRRTCRWLNPSHSTVCLSPSLQILASNYTWQCLLLVPSLAWLSSGSDSVGPKIACQEAARQGTKRRCWFCNKECETCSQPDTAQNQEVWKQQRMQGKGEGQGVRNKGVMVAVVTALMHEGVWFLMTIRSLNRAREEKKIAKGRVGSSNIVVGPRLSSPDLPGLT